jgi:hypothetical protein
VAYLLCIFIYRSFLYDQGEEYEISGACSRYDGDEIYVSNFFLLKSLWEDNFKRNPKEAESENMNWIQMLGIKS